jgi:hypothetical protein
MILMLVLGACSSASHNAAPTTTTGPTQRCTAYQKAHYPTGRAHVRAVSPNVVCVVEIGPAVTCTSTHGVFERTTYPKEMVEIDVARNGTGRVVHTFRQGCSRDEVCSAPMQGCGSAVEPMTATTSKSN